MESLLTTLLIAGVILVVGLSLAALLAACIVGSKIKKLWKSRND